MSSLQVGGNHMRAVWGHECRMSSGIPAFEAKSREYRSRFGDQTFTSWFFLHDFLSASSS